MGIPAGSLVDIAAQVSTGTLASATSSVAVSMRGSFNMTLSGTFAATVVPERSFDGGTTWLPVTFSDGTALSFSVPASGTWSEPEAGVLFRWRCTSYTSGTISWRFSQ